MPMLEHLLVGFQQALQWQTLLAMLVGEVVGILVGAAPGLTVTMAVSLMLPATFVLSPAAAMAMLLGVYTGGFMGNSIPAILIKIPGTPSAAATVFDGYALAQKGEAGKALGVSIIASLYGGLFSLICLVLIAPQLAKVALQFGSAEVFSLLLFGMSIICSFAQHSLVKGLISGLLGLMLVTVGLDPLLGTPRFTFGHVALTQGVSMIPAMIGIFAVPQVLEDLVAKGSQAAEAFKPKLSALLPSWREIRGLFGTFNRASIIGTIIGIIPGTGGPIATFMAYDYERRVSRDPQRFGHGAIEGVAASAGADNGVTGGALVPMLTLGIPGDPVTAVMLGALTIQGLRPGPLLFEQHAPFVYGLFASLLLANLLAALMTLVGRSLFGSASALTQGEPRSGGPSPLHYRRLLNRQQLLRCRNHAGLRPAGFRPPALPVPDRAGDPGARPGPVPRDEFSTRAGRVPGRSHGLCHPAHLVALPHLGRGLGPYFPPIEEYRKFMKG